MINTGEWRGVWVRHPDFAVHRNQDCWFRRTKADWTIGSSDTGDRARGDARDGPVVKRRGCL